MKRIIVLINIIAISFFVPAGAATQYLMNVCGLSNVAKFKKSK